MADGYSITQAFQASAYKKIEAGTNTAIVIKPEPGRQFGVLIWQQGASPVVFTDGVGGPPIAVIPSNATIGLYPFSSPAFTSINYAGGANCPGMTALYA